MDCGGDRRGWSGVLRSKSAVLGIVRMRSAAARFLHRSRFSEGVGAGVFLCVRIFVFRRVGAVSVADGRACGNPGGSCGEFAGGWGGSRAAMGAGVGAGDGELPALGRVPRFRRVASEGPEDVDQRRMGTAFLSRVRRRFANAEESSAASG